MQTAKTIFLIEDDRDDQQFFISALRNIEGVVLYDIANNGKEALDKLGRCTILPDLIFMDINMPVMGGIECLTAISQNKHINKIPVIILTSAIEHTELVCRLGAKALIAKSADVQALDEKMRHMIRALGSTRQNDASFSFAT